MIAFRVSAAWIEYAHGPGAESNQPLAIELCDLPANSKGQVLIPHGRRDLIEEIKSVAGLYVGGDDHDPRAARIIKRCDKALADLGEAQ